MTRTFASWARRYDDDTSRFGWTAPRRLADAVARERPIAPHLRVLDVGVGTGQASRRFLDAGAQVTGVDVEATMLRVAHKDARFHRLAKHDFDDALVPAVVDEGSMDIVIASGALHFAKRLDATLADLSRALAPGGTIAFTYVPPQAREFSARTTVHAEDAVAATVARLGLIVSRHERFVAYYEDGEANDPVVYALVVAHDRRPGDTDPALLARLDRTQCVDRARVRAAFAAPPLELRELGASDGAADCDVLCVVAHPDDEAVYLGGTIAALGARGHDVRVVVLTAGEAGRGPKRLAAVRARELTRAQEVLGIGRVESLGLPDTGKYADAQRRVPLRPEDAIAAWGSDARVLISDAIERHRPRVVVTFDPRRDPNLSLHAHHLACGALAIDAIDGATWVPERVLVVAPPGAPNGRPVRVMVDVHAKLGALRAHRSQAYSFEQVARAIERTPWRPHVEHFDVVRDRRDARVHGDVRDFGAPIARAQRKSPLVRAVVTRTADARRIYGIRDDREAAETIAAHADRTALCDELTRQASARGASAAEHAAIATLREANAVAVVTGQQTGLFGGPALTLLKLATAVHEARALTKRGMRAVPVFWMAAHDHDWREAATLRAAGRTVRLAPARAGVPVGAQPIGVDVARAIEDLRDAGMSTALDAARRHWVPGRTMTEAFARHLAELTANLGVVIVDPSTRAMHALARPAIERLLFDAKGAARAIADGDAAIAALGWPLGVRRPRERLSLFFVDDAGVRRAMTEIDGGFALDGGGMLSYDAATRALDATPERFTPSALSRPLFQSWMVPALAYVAGTNELVYLAQAAALLAWGERLAPTPILRASLWIPPRRPPRPGPLDPIEASVVELARRGADLPVTEAALRERAARLREAIDRVADLADPAARACRAIDAALAAPVATSVRSSRAARAGARLLRAVDRRAFDRIARGGVDDAELATIELASLVSPATLAASCEPARTFVLDGAAPTPLRVAIVAMGGLGGSSAVAVTLARALAARGHRVEVITGRTDFFLAGETAVDICVLDTPDSPGDGDPSAVAAHVARLRDVDAVHVHYATPALLRGVLDARDAARGTFGVVATLHGTDVTHVAAERRDALRAELARCDAVTAVSTWLAQEAARLFGVRARVVTNPARFARSSAARVRALRAELAPHGEHLVLHAPNLRPVKRPSDAVAVLAKLVASGRRVRLVMAGTGPLAADVERAVRDAGVDAHCARLGIVAPDDMADLVAACDVGLVTSESESSSLFAAECLAAGIPCVVTATGGVLELIEDDDLRASCVAPVGDVARLASLVASLLDDDRRRAAIGARLARAMAHRDDAASLAAYERILGAAARERQTTRGRANWSS